MNERETMIATASFAAGWDAALDEARKAVAIVTVNKDTSYEMRVQALAVIEALWKEAMTDHLPECLNDDDTYGLRGLCICDELRACEQRVLNLNPAAHDVLIAQRARERALDAARAAVGGMVIETVGNSAATVDQALAAIDALKDKP